MPKYEGTAYIFGTCKNHTLRNLEALSGDVGILTHHQKAEAVHIHCYECGCIKSIGPCPIRNFTFEPEALTPEYGEMEEKPQFVLINQGTTISEAQDASPVAIEIAANVRFNIQWNTEKKSYAIDGDLPAELASQVIDLVRNYRQH